MAGKLDFGVMELLVVEAGGYKEKKTAQRNPLLGFAEDIKDSVMGESQESLDVKFNDHFFLQTIISFKIICKLTMEIFYCCSRNTNLSKPFMMS